jgi:hypothetical protein
VGAPLLVVTPWYPVRGTGSALDAAVAAAVHAAARAGADVTVVHLVPAPVPDDDVAGPVTVRRVVVPGGVAPGDTARIDAVAAALAAGAADLLGAAAVVHAHGAVPVAAAVARVAPEGARLIVGEHLPSAVPLLAAGPEDALTAAWRAVQARVEVVLAPSEDLARRLAARVEPAGSTRFEVLLYPATPFSAAAPTAISTPLPPAAPAQGAEPTQPTAATLPATRWLLLGPVTAGGPVVRALAADALAGAPTTLTVAGTEGDEAVAGLLTLAARLGVERRIVLVAPEALLALLAGAPAADGGGDPAADPAVDLAVGPDPLAAADPVLTAAFVAGIPAVLARAAGSEDLVDEVAATGLVRIVQPGARVVALLEAVADLRRHELAPERARRPAGLLAPWRTSPDGPVGVLARHYGETVASPPPGAGRRHWPRVLLVDLTGGHRNEIGGVARWLVGIGGEPVVVTAAAPPPSSGLHGAVSVDLRPVERAVAGQRLQGARRRLPGLARPAFDRALLAYRTLRRPPTLVDAALAGPLARDTGPSPEMDAVVAADPASAELARRWTGAGQALPPDTDRLIVHLTSAAADHAGSVSRSPTASHGGIEGS